MKNRVKLGQYLKFTLFLSVCQPIRSGLLLFEFENIYPAYYVNTDTVIVIKFKTCDMAVCLVLAKDNGHQEHLKDKRILVDRD